MGLRVAACQLSLFPWRPESDLKSVERHDSRTPDQLIRSVIAYLEWRAGESWRNLTFRADRNDQDRWDYLDAVRLVAKMRYAEPRRPQLVLPGPVTAFRSPNTKQVRELACRPRACLVDRLMRADPSLTDRKILMHLGRLKLAGMLAVRSESRSRLRTA